MINENKTTEENSTKKWRWYHGVLFYAGVQAVSFGLGKLVSKVVEKSEPQLTEQITGNPSYFEFYNELKQPVFAPPDRAFAPAWTINNALMIWGLVRVLNMPQEKTGRNEFMAWQKAFWITFVIFNPLFFGLRSPILGAIDTNIGLALTAGGTVVAWSKLKDSKTVVLQSPTLLWLTLAAATATTIAVWNKDEFFDSRPIVEPVASSGWVKKN